MTSSRDLGFWRNVAVIAIAHAAVLVGIAQWGGKVKKPSASDVVWIAGGAGGPTAPAPPTQESAPVAETIPAPPIEAPPAEEQDQQILNAKNDIDVAQPTPPPTTKPQPTAAPKPSATAKPRPSSAPTPKSTPKPTPKKTLLAKASPKPTAAPAEKSDPESDAAATAEVSAQTASGPAGPAPGSPGSASQFNWYSNMLHDRFNAEWVQPKTAAATGAKMSTLVQLRIERDGRVSAFSVIRSSGNVVVDESVSAVARRVTRVDPPPGPLAASGHYDVRINFELDVE